MSEWVSGFRFPSFASLRRAGRFQVSGFIDFPTSISPETFSDFPGYIYFSVSCIIPMRISFWLPM
ncbi:MAG: hypothetical protein B6D64_13740 [Bacteroidetes bacterium 4484_276]|nr:MAG: hypothetical protein B6D64_13740 [Bacteroidetes bacterium 4484_276]